MATSPRRDRRGRRPVEGVWRELEEETGLTPNEVHLVDEYPEWTVYEWPEGVKQGGQPARPGATLVLLPDQ